MPGKSYSYHAVRGITSTLHHKIYALIKSPFALFLFELKSPLEIPQNIAFNLLSINKERKEERKEFN